MKTTTIPDKNYFRIGEVSKILDVEPYVLRYWESEFSSIRPMRTDSDQRLYRKSDVMTLLTIKRLLYDDMYTIAGAKKKLSVMRKKGTTSPAGGEDLLETFKRELIAIRKIVE